MNPNFLHTPVASLSQQILTQLKGSSSWELMRPHAAAARIICETTGLSTVLADAARTNFTSAYLRPDASGNPETAAAFRMLVFHWNYLGGTEVSFALAEDRLSPFPVLGKTILSPTTASLLGAVLCERPDDPAAQRHLISFLDALASPLARLFEELENCDAPRTTSDNVVSIMGIS